MSRAWKAGSTHTWRKTRAMVLMRDGHRCQLRIDGVCTTHATQAHHVHGRAVTGDDPAYVVAACQSCNQRVGRPDKTTAHATVVGWVRDNGPVHVSMVRAQHQTIPPGTIDSVLNRAVKRGELVKPAPATYAVGPVGFFRAGTPLHPPLPVFSLSPGAVDGADLRPDLAWSPVALAAHEWLAPFVEVPIDAAPPLAMTPPTDDAVGSYGPQAVEWVERMMGVELRWWQRLAITRQLEHRADGTLTWRSVVESCPRRAGKSVRVRGVAMWRLAHAELAGEVQTVVHTGSDLPICREVQRGAWRYAEAQGWKVTRANGKEAVEAFDGSRWLVRAQDAVYGYDAGLAVVDEGWNVKPDTVSEGLEPAMLERCWPQLHITSTAHRRATSLMKQRIRDALTVDDGETLLLLWAAGVGKVADPGDEGLWRAASPHWSEDRRRMIAGKYAAAVAGEADPQVDDPDPMQGFLAQYLNVWQLRSAPAERGDAVLDADEWSALAVPTPDGPPDAAAVEAWFGDGVSLALAWRADDRVVVSVRALDDLSGVAPAVQALGYRRPVIVGASLLDDPSLKGLRTRAGQGRVGTAVQDLRRLLDEDVLRHDGGDHLTEQVVRIRTLPGADGPRMASKGAADAVKAAVWAAGAARRASTGKPRLIVAE